MITHILIMDDQPQEIEPLQRYLSDEGYVISLVNSASDAKRSILEGNIDIVLLDVDMLPQSEIQLAKLEQERLGQQPFVPEEGQGFEVAAWVRNYAEDVGVIILSKRGSVQDRVGGLDRGADDYIIKGELELPEAASRVRAVLRRRKPLPKNRALFADNELNLTSQKLQLRNGVVVQLTEAEFKLIKFLTEHPRMIFSREKLYREVHRGESPSNADRAIDTLVSKIRKKIGVIREDVSLIATVHGQGYRFDADVEYKS